MARGAASSVCRAQIRSEIHSDLGRILNRLGRTEPNTGIIYHELFIEGLREIETCHSTS